MPAVPDKTKAERLQETIRLLKKLKEIGFSEIDTGYNEIKALLSQWVADGEEATATVEFARHGRRAEVELQSAPIRPRALLSRSCSHSFILRRFSRFILYT